MTVSPLVDIEHVKLIFSPNERLTGGKKIFKTFLSVPLDWHQMLLLEQVRQLGYVPSSHHHLKKQAEIFHKVGCQVRTRARDKKVLSTSQF